MKDAADDEDDEVNRLDGRVGIESTVLDPFNHHLSP